MAKIHTPVKGYNGISATVVFINGVGQCDDPFLLQWFKAKGYRVEPAEQIAVTDAPVKTVELIKEPQPIKTKKKPTGGE